MIYMTIKTNKYYMCRQREDKAMTKLLRRLHEMTENHRMKAKLKIYIVRMKDSNEIQVR